jgi:hypothetical protein
MIGTENIVVDKRFFDPAFFNDIPGGEKIINAPPDIAIAGFKAIRPPRVFDGVRIKMPEGVNIAVFNDTVEPIALDS